MHLSFHRITKRWVFAKGNKMAVTLRNYTTAIRRINLYFVCSLHLRGVTTASASHTE
jgi:hypothetical protein